MDILQAIKTRRSIRKFDTTKEVAVEQVEKILEAAQWAPSAGNEQSWYFYVVRDKSIKEKLYDATNGQEHMIEASVVIVSCADLDRCEAKYNERGRELYAVQDATIATQNMWLMLHSLGLGAVWVGAFEEEEVREILDIPDNLRPVAMLPVGYPRENPAPRQRRKIGEISKTI